jgi:hypothetical protein
MPRVSGTMVRHAMRWRRMGGGVQQDKKAHCASHYQLVERPVVATEEWRMADSRRLEIGEPDPASRAGGHRFGPGSRSRRLMVYFRGTERQPMTVAKTLGDALDTSGPVIFVLVSDVYADARQPERDTRHCDANTN